MSSVKSFFLKWYPLIFQPTFHYFFHVGFYLVSNHHHLGLKNIFSTLNSKMLFFFRNTIQGLLWISRLFYFSCFSFTLFKKKNNKKK